MKAVVWHDVGKISVDEVADPSTVITHRESMPTVLEAYEAFDRREPGWTKITLELS